MARNWDIQDPYNSDWYDDPYNQFPEEPPYEPPPPPEQAGPAPPPAPEPAPAPAPAPAPGPAPAPAPNPLGPFNRTFQPPTLQPYPNLPALPQLPPIPDVPLPQLPTRPTPPPFQFDAYAQAPSWSYQDFQYAPWTPPSVEEALQDPSYQFRKQQGEQSLQNWAAARGTLNDSGTAKALTDYGQNAASQEYSNIWNRGLEGYRTNFNSALGTYAMNRGNSLEAFNTNEGNRAGAYDRNRALAVDTYNTNYRTQYEDPYRAKYTEAIDTWIPQMEGWRQNVDQGRLGYTTAVDQGRLGYTTDSNRIQRNNEMNYGNAWDRFLFDYEKWKNGPIDDQSFIYGTTT